MPQHPDAHIRRAIRVLAMVGELHRIGYQRLRVMPFMSPSGANWRCWIGPVNLFYRNHGAILCEDSAALPANSGQQSTDLIARYTSSTGNRYFDWDDAMHDNARLLADKFLDRFRMIAKYGAGWNYNYAGWYQRVLGLAERGWIPVVISDGNRVQFDRIPLYDFRPKEWQNGNEERPRLPLPPTGKLPRDYTS